MKYKCIFIYSLTLTVILLIAGYKCCDSYSRIKEHEEFFKNNFKDSLKKNGRDSCVKYTVEIHSLTAGRNHGRLQIRNTEAPMVKGR